jgi:hypothetical protein
VTNFDKICTIFFFRRVLSAPLRWAGALSDAQIVSTKVFSNYKEQRNVPFANFKLIIKSRGETSPKVLSATVRVHLRVGLIRRVLYHLRPHSLIALSMGAGAACAIVGGSIGAGFCIAVLIYTIMLRSKQERGGGGGGGGGRNNKNGRPGSSISGDFSSESGSDVLGGDTSSSSAGTTPRKLDLSEEDDGGVGSPLSPSPSRREEKPWQVLLKQIPFPSPQRQSPATKEDTPFVGNETAARGGGNETTAAGENVGGGASGRTELGAAGMRYRGGT